MKKLVSLFFLLALLVSGCSREEMLDNESTTPGGRIFTTSFEQNETRTYVEDGRLSRWTAGDRISLFDGNSWNLQYQFDGETEDSGGTFSMVDITSGTGSELLTNYAVYPYDKDIKVTKDGNITVNLPSDQHYAENSFGLGDNTMVAVTHNIYDTSLTFKNVGGFFKLQLYGDDVTVKSITLTGNNNEKIAGKAEITAAYDKAPIVNMADNAFNSITLDCGKGVKIGTTQETATTFWVVLPPVTFEKGITVTVTDVNDLLFVKSAYKELMIERNTVKPMAAVKVKPDVPYLTFAAGAVQEFSMSKAVENLEYSVDGGTWSELGKNTVEFGGELGLLRLRGKNLNGTTTGSKNPIEFSKEDVCVACNGDIRTLIDYANYLTVETKDARFCQLFSEAVELTQAPKLPATTLADKCYEKMFYECHKLTKAPELPATTLAKECYSSMFFECIGLTEAPQLPATTLAERCYHYMFSECHRLIKAPELPAKTLADRCYAGMFSGCRSLTETPELPATTLAPQCYSNMFNECKALVSAHNLPATTLAYHCYFGMFDYCASLTKAPKLPATTLAEGCYWSMFIHCTSLTTAPDLPATTLARNCYHTMFSGCSNLIKTPKLPATTLADYCYASMFSGCSSLTETPELPATTLAINCYGGMFYDCESLTKAPELPATTLAYACYSSMFAHCTSLTKAPKLPATTLERLCYDGMFQHCKNLIEAPVLPATTLLTKCYAYMFRDCNKLSSVTMLATYIPSGNSCLEGWLSDVSPTGTLIKAKEMEALPEDSSSGIPKGWTVKNYGE